jgi:hypothetical protein
MFKVGKERRVLAALFDQFRQGSFQHTLLVRKMKSIFRR